ncbi:NUDIX domain-containing protein [Amycolatopsis sp. ATCC 39116]|uniref:NUDIX domain-containing protein n=1 Tax=Amycolatopsis sp. (strain ATCC 39116 / 75iv2) TaxID=385957 RepID=UPI0012FC8385
MGVHILLVDNGNLPLTRRRDTNPAFDRPWHLNSGKLDAGESVLHAEAREAHEKVGVLINLARHLSTALVRLSGCCVLRGSNGLGRPNTNAYSHARDGSG